jgi:hypothetical protein
MANARREPQQPISDELFKTALFRLAQFNPTALDDKGGQAADYVTLQSLACFGMMPANPTEVSKAIYDMFRVRFEPAEVEGAAKRLALKGLASVEDLGRNQPALLRISATAAEDVDRSLAEMRELENRVLTDWREYIGAQYRAVPEVAEHAEHIERCLQIFTARMLAKHGIQCAALLYPEELKSQTWLDSIKQDIVAELPKVNALLDATVLIEVPAFFRSTEPSRVKYINDLLNSSYFWHTMQVDETCSRLLKSVTGGQTLYFDVNVLYSLSGLHGEHLLKSSHGAVKLAKALGYVLAVTTKSIDEFQSSLGARQRQYQGRPPVPRDLVKLVIQTLNDEDYVTSYWKELAKSGASIEEFVSEKSHLEGLLESLDISVTDEFREEIENSKELREQESILRLACSGSMIDSIVQHDAYHRLYVLRKRGSPKYHLSDAVAWFLTHDTKLAAFDREARARTGQLNALPFCMTTNEWVQVNRPLLPRAKDTAEYEESFYRLVTQPFIRSIVQRFSLTKAYQEVLGRAARYRNMTPQLALSLVADRRVVILTAVESDVNKADLIVENKFLDVASQLRTENAELARRVDAGTQTSKRMKSEFEIYKTEQEARVTELSRTVGALTNAVSGAKARGDSASSDAMRARKLLEGSRWVIFVLALLLFTAAVWLQPLVVNWPWLAGHRCQVFMRIAAQFLVVFALLNIPLYKHWKVWLSIAGAAALALLPLAASAR